MKVSKFMGIVVLFTALGIGIAGHQSTEAVSAKTRITSSQKVKKTPARIKTNAYNVYAYPRALQSSSKFMHYGTSRHSTTFYITKTIKLSNGQSYSWLADNTGKGYGYINKKAITVYASPKTDVVDYSHTPVRIKTYAYDVYSYPKALHGNATFKHYGTSRHSTTFFVSKNITTVNNVKYAKLTYGGGTVYGYINAKALKNYKTVKNVKNISSNKIYYLAPDPEWYSTTHGLTYTNPIYTAYGAKINGSLTYGHEYIITKTETRTQDGSKFSYLKEVTYGGTPYNIGWVHSSQLADHF